MSSDSSSDEREVHDEPKVKRRNGAAKKQKKKKEEKPMSDFELQHVILNTLVELTKLVTEQTVRVAKNRKSTTKYVTLYDLEKFKELFDLYGNDAEKLKAAASETSLTLKTLQYLLKKHKEAGPLVDEIDDGSVSVSLPLAHREPAASHPPVITPAPSRKRKSDEGASAENEQKKAKRKKPEAEPQKKKETKSKPKENKKSGKTEVAVPKIPISAKKDESSSVKTHESSSVKTPAKAKETSNKTPARAPSTSKTPTAVTHSAPKIVHSVNHEEEADSDSHSSS